MCVIGLPSFYDDPSGHAGVDLLEDDPSGEVGVSLLVFQFEHHEVT